LRKVLIITKASCGRIILGEFAKNENTEGFAPLLFSD
jgi:hypothetical protein